MSTAPRTRKSLIGGLTAQAISLSGTRLSAIALPWFVLTSTGSATKTGLVAFAEMAPYVVAKALCGPLTDRFGPRRITIPGDILSFVTVGAIPLLYFADLLPFGLLLALVAVAGAVRGPADAAKEVFVPDIAEDARVPLERVTGLFGSVERLSGVIGPGLAGALIALIGPVAALAIDAGTFLVAAGLIWWTSPRRHQGHGGDEPYFAQLKAGFSFLRRERLLRSIIGMVGVTNLLDAAMAAVLIPVWVKSNGYGPEIIGLVGSAFGATAVVGSILAAGIAERLPRRVVYLVGFLLGGAPRFLVLAFDAPLWLIVTTYVIGGFGVGFINPVIGAIFFERVPRELLGRANSIGDALAFAGIPFGGMVGAGLIALLGIAPALGICGVVYLITTTLPGLQREWASMAKVEPPDVVKDQLAGSK